MKTNETLRKDVVEELRWDPLLRDVVNEIDVLANDGVVTLSGQVNTYSQKLAAEKAAQRVLGVTVVAVDLEVKLSSLHIKSDTEIAQAIRSALKWNTAVQEDAIEVKVDNGWVYLEGSAEWEYQRKSVEQSVRNLMGVRGVSNKIKVKTVLLNPEDIRKRISSAFHRSATLDSSNIVLGIQGSRVTLSGKVRSWSEREDAEKAAWSSPGVMVVDNKIGIETEVFA